MILLGVDPGVTTGYCVVDVNYKGIFVREAAHLNHNISLSGWYKYLVQKYRPEAIIMESAVPTGLLNEEKRVQLSAMDRLVVVADETETPLGFVTPERRKREKHVPAEVKGAHARDAYRVVVAYLRSRGERLYTENETITNKN